MKTALYSQLYLAGNDAFGSSRLHRCLRWTWYHLALKEQLGFDKIVFVTDGDENLEEFMEEVKGEDIGFLLRPKLSFTGIPKHDYPWCWRALFETQALMAQGYDKIITLDTDGYILTPRLASYIKGLDTGWSAFWEQKHQFPTAELHILCKDAFPKFLKYMDELPWALRNGRTMETDIPLTLVNRDFNCARFGEDRTPQNPTMDFYGQAPLDIDLKFQKE